MNQRDTTMDTPTLEQQVFALMREHGLSQISIHFTDGEQVYSFAHRGKGLCGMSEHADAASEAIGQAIALCPSNVPVAVDDLPSIEGLAA